MHRLLSELPSPTSASPTVASLFAGAGGMDLGFEYAGFNTVWANDMNTDACATHRRWSHADVVHRRIEVADLSLVPDVDVVLGGFPCQGFSLAGPRQVDDSRNILYQYFVALVTQKQPKMFVAENVRGILSLGGGAIADAIVNDFETSGYRVTYRLVNAADYGVPQDRWRVFFVGIRNDINAEFSYPQSHDTQPTLSSVLADMPLSVAEDVCDAAFSPRYMSRNRRRNWDEPSFTIPAMAKQVALHPSSPAMSKVATDHWEFGKGVTRRLSWREAAVIQTFPIDLEFAGNLVSQYKQIGNAVPVNLAYAMAQEVMKTLNTT